MIFYHPIVSGPIAYVLDSVPRFLKLTKAVANSSRSDTNPLKEAIIGLRRQNNSGQLYVPPDPLLDCLTEDIVRLLLHHDGLEGWIINDLAQSFLDGKQKIYAILVFVNAGKSIVKFIEKYNYQPSTLDYKLPSFLRCSRCQRDVF